MQKRHPRQLEIVLPPVKGVQVGHEQYLACEFSSFRLSIATFSNVYKNIAFLKRTQIVYIILIEIDEINLLICFALFFVSVFMSEI